MLFGAAAAAELRGAGATFPANLYFAWIDAFHDTNTDGTVTYDAVGSGEGIRRFREGLTDFGATDRPLDDEEIAAAEDGVLHAPATAGMVVIPYNIPGLSGELRLSRTVLGGIFAGEITYWDDPLILADNPELNLPHRTIAVVSRRDSSGTTYAFTSHLSEISDIWRISGRGAGMLVDWPGATMTAPGNEGVAGRIEISEYSIDYTEFSFARALGLPVALIQNRAGNFVKPDLAAGTAALADAAAAMPTDGRQSVVDPDSPEAYPIVSYSWLLLHRSYENPEVASLLKSFVGWGLDQGQAMAGPIGYIPLPPEVAGRSKAMLDSIR